MQHILLRQAHQLRVFVSRTDLLQVSLWYILASLHIHLALCKFATSTCFSGIPCRSNAGSTCAASDMSHTDLHSD